MRKTCLFLASWAEVFFFALVILVTSCATTRPRFYRGTIVEVTPWRSLHGAVHYRMTIEFRDNGDVLQHVTQDFDWGSRERLLFGEVGREVCLEDYSGALRMKECK